ncbi:MAG TPA: DUF4145 domain-containing protein [Steroidobacteraceae bacterium]|nr:DUF4145 domain-containing protein [Steroidobacteraceae bacterium]
MALLVENCPRCKAQHMTFDVLEENILQTNRYGWQRVSELFCRCHRCGTAVIFMVVQATEAAKSSFFESTALTHWPKAINDIVRVEGYISLKDFAAAAPPDHCPPEVEAAFREGATCLAVKCFNAAGTMFRLCVDLATRDMLPDVGTEGGPNTKQRRDLGLRLPWLFENGKLPDGLRDLSHCIKEDGNDGAHAGTLTKQDAEDLLDFATALLERVYTEPERLKLAKERREQRRKPPAAG